MPLLGSPTSRGVLQLVGLLPRISRPRTVLFVCTTVAMAVLPLSATIAIGLLIGTVPDLVDSGPGSVTERHAYLLLGTAAIAMLFQRLVDHLHRANARNLGRDLELLLQDRLITAVGRPEGIEHLEDDDVLALLRITRRLGMDFIRPERAVEGLAAIAPQFLIAAGASAVLAFFNLWIGLAWFLAWPVIFLAMQAQYTRMGKTGYLRSSKMRETEYLRDLVIDSGPAKEIRIWGMLSWLLERYDRNWSDRLDQARADERVRKSVAVGVVASLFTLTAVSAFALVGAGLAGAIGFGALGVHLFALRAMFDFSAFDDEAAFVSFGAMPVPKIRELDHRLETSRRTATAELPATAPARSIRFENIEFSYPGAELPVFSELSLEVAAGTSLAIVGRNGAGKTSLVKLLAGLYTPDSGAILVDGVKLADIDSDRWRGRLSALFQDFTRYRLTVRDNITLGAPDIADDTDRIWKACEPMGIADLIRSLPDGLDTVLSSEFDGGIDLSGGQWQRIALARALFAVQAGAKVLILDEPAAALDVRAEAELYEQFLDITAGVTTIVISHRFSTVRRADRIVVLDGGRIVEDGSHEELMAVGGGYAEAFGIQASRLARRPTVH